MTVSDTSKLTHTTFTITTTKRTVQDIAVRTNSSVKMHTITSAFQNVRDAMGSSSATIRVMRSTAAVHSMTFIATQMVSVFRILLDATADSTA